MKYKGSLSYMSVCEVFLDTLPFAQRPVGCLLQDGVSLCACEELGTVGPVEKETRGGLWPLLHLPAR